MICLQYAITKGFLKSTRLMATEILRYKIGTMINSKSGSLKYGYMWMNV